MESKVKYRSPEEIRGLPTSEIASMTMLSGDVIIIGTNSQQDLSILGNYLPNVITNVFHLFKFLVCKVQTKMLF